MSVKKFVSYDVSSSTGLSNALLLSKKRIALRYWLLGAGFVDSVKAFDFAEQFHSGTRKDGVSPEFSHQIAIVNFLRTLTPLLASPQDTFTVGFLHDVREDYNVSDEAIRNLFGSSVANAVDALTKTFNGVDRVPADVFDAIANDSIASVVKGADRINNQQTMLGVFSVSKIVDYMDDTRVFFFPMLKKARRLFPVQDAVYELEKLMLQSQLELLSATCAGSSQSQDLNDF